MISPKPKKEFMILVPAIAHSLFYDFFFQHCVFYFAISFHWSYSTETISLKKKKR